MEWSLTPAAAEADEVRGGGLRRRTSSRQRRYSGDFSGRVVVVMLADQPMMPSQRESLSSRPRVERRA